MIAYLVNQIMIGKLTYNQVITKRADLKEAIDTYITDQELDIDNNF